MWYLVNSICCLKQIDNLNSECDKLKQANSELQRQRDNLEDEKEDVSKDKERQVKENQRWYVCIHPLPFYIPCQFHVQSALLVFSKVLL